MGIQLFILAFLLIIAPLIIGTLFKKTDHSPAFYWISGQLLLWAGFFAICVPLIWVPKGFSLVCKIFNAYTFSLLMVALWMNLFPFLIRMIKNKKVAPAKINFCGSKASYILWSIFAILLLIQLVLSVILAYEEGDDAYYIATATLSQDTVYLYQKLPYTGLTTTPDFRHALAPFPIWITYLGKMSGMAPVSVAQVVLAVTMIGLAYSIYYLIAQKLCEGDSIKTPFFLILIELLIMFGGYSLYTAENFLLVRASQGKAVLASIVLPFLLYLFLLLLEKIQNQKHFTWNLWLLMTLCTAAACLCSTQGTILTCATIGVTGLCATISYRKLSFLFWLASTCILPIVVAILYFAVR